MKTVVVEGRTYRLPKKLIFWSDVNPCKSSPRRLREYAIEGMRPPRRGEYYLSGAVVAAHMAPNDLSSAYIVVRPL